MSDDRRDEDKIVDEILRPDDSPREKRIEHARRRPPSTRRSDSSGRKPKGKSGGKSRRIFLWVLILVLIGAGGWYGWQQLQPEMVDTEFTATDEDIPQTQTPSGDRAVVLVYPEWDASGFVTEERQIPSRDRGGEDLLSLMQILCQGPSVSGAVSAFPQDTRALSAFFNPDDNSVVLDFSEELVTGHPGGTTAELATLTSILRTVALNFPDTRSCTILVDGSQVETLAGNLTMDQPFDPRRWL